MVMMRVDVRGIHQGIYRGSSLVISVPILDKTYPSLTA